MRARARACSVTGFCLFKVTHMTVCVRVHVVSGGFVCLTTNPVKCSDFYVMTCIGLITAIRRAVITKMDIS